MCALLAIWLVVQFFNPEAPEIARKRPDPLPLVGGVWFRDYSSIILVLYASRDIIGKAFSEKSPTRY